MSAATDALTRRAKMLQEGALKVAERFDDKAMVKNLGPTSPPIAFHLWHMARWADRMVSRVSAGVPRIGARPEIWTSEKLAEAWHVEVPMGKFDSGMEMGDEAAASMSYPSKRALMDYVRRAFDAANEIYEKVSDEDLAITARDLYDRESTVASMLVANLTHLNRHLGMVEALIGVGGTKGSASV